MNGVSDEIGSASLFIKPSDVDGRGGGTISPIISQSESSSPMVSDVLLSSSKLALFML